MFYLIIKDGKNKRKSLKGYKTKEEAENRKNEMMNKSKKFNGKIKIINEIN